MNKLSDESSQPVKSKERIAFLDILRGFALFGILFANLLTWSGLKYLPIEDIRELGNFVGIETYGCWKNRFLQRFKCLEIEFGNLGKMGFYGCGKLHDLGFDESGKSKRCARTLSNFHGKGHYVKPFGW